MAESNSSKLAKRIHTDGAPWFKSGSAPSSPVTGDLWYDTTNKKLFGYDGSGWVQFGGPTFDATGGTSSTYVVGTTESFSYNTAFKTMGGVVTQIGTAGGEAEWAIKESGLSTTATLYIAQNADTSFIDFGLDDSQTDTKRTWTLIVDFTVQNVHNLSLPYGTDWALYQDYNNIVLMNYDYLVWN